LNVINQITDPAPNSDYGTGLFTFNERPSNVYRTAIQAVLTKLSHKLQHIQVINCIYQNAKLITAAYKLLFTLSITHTPFKTVAAVDAQIKPKVLMPLISVFYRRPSKPSQQDLFGGKSNLVKK
jgi:hypothetical protein